MNRRKAPHSNATCCGSSGKISSKNCSSAAGVFEPAVGLHALCSDIKTFFSANGIREKLAWSNFVIFTSQVDVGGVLTGMSRRTCHNQLWTGTGSSDTFRLDFLSGGPELGSRDDVIWGRIPLYAYIVPSSIVLQSHLRFINYNELCRDMNLTRANCYL